MLVDHDTKTAPERRSVAVPVGLKLVAQPAVTWLPARVLSGVSPHPTHAEVALAALPTATGPFVPPELCGRDESVRSRGLRASAIAFVLRIIGSLAPVG